MDLFCLEFQGSGVKCSHRSRDCNGLCSARIATVFLNENMGRGSRFTNESLSQDIWLKARKKKAAAGYG